MTNTCPRCGDDIDPRRTALGYCLCLWCGEDEAKAERRSWTVLTPHKQGPMFFTSDFAREAAKGINNKGGIYR
jgi:hypothetical protein